MKREDIKRILIIGSGPIIIGQACEFDYSGTQACKALKNLGYELVLVNSNPATIMTDPILADATYIEPLNTTRLEQIIIKEKPDAILPNLGGQSGLNLCLELSQKGILDKYGVEVIGVALEAIKKGEDRIEFKKLMNSIGVEMAASEVAYNLQEAKDKANKLGYPLVIRPAYTMGGTGGGIVYNEEELLQICGRGLKASLVGQVLIEECVLGWEELELELVRDAKGQMICVCFIENIDPLGVHTGDSVCSAPMLTISDEVQQELKRQAFKIVDSIGVIGGTNVQFARDPVSGKIIVIEINPRTSRSSALASKATGFPIALISAMLACGLSLDEIPCGKHGSLDKYQPSGDYVVIKFARWAFEKFQGVKDQLGTQMRAVGEVMSIGKTYKEALQKAVRSLENGRFGLGFVKNFNSLSLQDLLKLLEKPSSERQFIIYEALRKGADIETLHKLTSIKHYFIEQMKELVDEEENLVKAQINKELLLKAKKNGFGDKYLADILGKTEREIRAIRLSYGIYEKWEAVHVSGTQNKCYYYSSYNIEESAAVSNSKQKIMILGSGPNRIGQGIEFDYCCVHAAFAIKALGFETIMVNCNPETVSTDYDTADKLYFEPLTVEEVLSIYQNEKPLGIIVQFGGQTPLNIAKKLQENGANILGTQPDVIAAAEDRDLFRAMMDKLNIAMPESGMAINVQEAISLANSIGYPIMARPSFVLGGRNMEVIYDDQHMEKYMLSAKNVSKDKPILIDRFLQNAMECEADAICDGNHAYVPALMEQIELAGIHSGDSACLIPSQNISTKNINLIKQYTKQIAEQMGVVGLMNIQYAIEKDKVYVIEANPRASRTVPLVSKVCAINMVASAINIILSKITGKFMDISNIKDKYIPYIAVKKVVLPFNMFPEVDPLLGPEMRSTGEVLGIGDSFCQAYIKAEEATGAALPESGCALISINDKDKKELAALVSSLREGGYSIAASLHTYEHIKALGYEALLIEKENITKAISEGKIQIIFNTPSTMSSEIRRKAIEYKIPYTTTMAAALASAKCMSNCNRSLSRVASLQYRHSQIQNQ